MDELEIGVQLGLSDQQVRANPVAAVRKYLQQHDDAMAKLKKNRTYIVKPVNSAMGKGIFLVTSVDQLYVNHLYVGETSYGNGSGNSNGNGNGNGNGNSNSNGNGNN